MGKIHKRSRRLGPSDGGHNCGTLLIVTNQKTMAQAHAKERKKIGWVVGPNYKYQIKSFLFGGEETYTRVDWSYAYYSILEMNTVITEWINPHNEYECDCVNAQHPKRFKLRMAYLGKDHSTGDLKVGIYIMCEPQMNVRYQVEGAFKGKCLQETVSNNYVGWQYLTTIYWSDFYMDMDDLVSGIMDHSIENKIITLKLFVDKNI